MDIGSSEMSQKIRSAIKAKLVDLGSYVDDELPDYIMVMVANKKTEAQMTDDLSLFLGNNTLIFTSWLHTVLTKLSQPASEPKPKKVKESTTKTKKIKEKKVAGASGAHQKQTKGIDPQPGKPGHSVETTMIMPPTASMPSFAAAKGTKPEPTQVVISLKPETNDFLDEELAQEEVDSETAKRQSAVIAPLQPKALSRTSSQPKEVIKKVSSHHHSATNKVSPTQTSRKRKAPGSVIGQVLNVQEDEDSDEPSSFGKKVASTVLPQRRPTLPMAKQANTSLLKKAVCAAEASTSQVLSTLTRKEPPKTTQAGPRRIKIVRKLQSSVPRRNLLKAVNDAAKQSIKSRLTLEMPAPGLVSRSKMMELSERDYDTQEFITVSDSSTSQQVEEYYADDEEQDDNEVLDTRQICMETEMPSQPVIYVIRDENVVKKAEQPTYTPTPGVVESSHSETSPTRPVSPKFIVTLEGAVKANTKQRKSARVAPRLSSFTRTIDNSSMYADFVNMQQQQQQTHQAEEEHALQQRLQLAQQEAALLQQKNQLLEQHALQEYSMEEDIHVYSRQTHHPEKAQEETQEQFEKEAVSPLKKELSTNERCLFWPACRKGSDCIYVHPTTPCRTFPKCKFGDKCLFIHPNCKYGARCSRTNCPFTHATRKQASQGPVSPTLIVAPTPVPQKVAKVCRFHPNCTNVNCSFLHPKMCMYGRACTRSGCLFTHPKVATGAALKWTKQSHISERQFAAKGTPS
ncbi:zinc finger CCCH domain-containing protein 14-like [Asterias rubens]|uniref:zinc finger CCCH domain-containing protein 14-like n=1 Tax=Asterias rubens TaxID=7604 RepID=UPI001455B6DD|nr:zinc finger CCCH domain-containing protein 14-like [Asterias rubens]